MIFQAELVEILINILHYLNNPLENDGPIKYHRWIPQILPPKGRYSLQTWIENFPFRQAIRCFFVKHCSKMPKYQKNSNFRRKTILGSKISSYSPPSQKGICGIHLWVLARTWGNPELARPFFICLCNVHIVFSAYKVLSFLPPLHDWVPAWGIYLYVASQKNTWRSKDRNLETFKNTLVYIFITTVLGLDTG